MAPDDFLEASEQLEAKWLEASEWLEAKRQAVQSLLQDIATAPPTDAAERPRRQRPSAQEVLNGVRARCERLAAKGQVVWEQQVLQVWDRHCGPGPCRRAASILGGFAAAAAAWAAAAALWRFVCFIGRCIGWIIAGPSRAGAQPLQVALTTAPEAPGRGRGAEALD